MRPLPGFINSKKNPRLRIILLLIIIVVVAGAYFVWQHYTKEPVANVAETTSPSKLETNSKQFYDSQLKKSDLSGYQQTQASLASLYIVNGDLENAEKVLNNVLAKVPKNKIISDTYGTFVELEKAKNNDAGYKHYMNLYIDQLKKEGDKTAAAQQQKVLDSGL